jgi:hypothetical protein
MRLWRLFVYIATCERVGLVEVDVILGRRPLLGKILQ